jgi:polyisoprenyl-phosphate glycosyltransferase
MSQPQTVTIVLPVYDDWESLRLLVAQLDLALAQASVQAQVLVLDDGSPTRPALQLSQPLHAISEIRVLRLRRNLGHQRAIAIGLAYVVHETSAGTIVVMDADGEDKPTDVPRLLQKFREHGGTPVVFAERTRRSEGFSFRIFYQVYRVIHLLLTGIAVKVGNFSVLSSTHASTLSVVAETWNHYAASVLKVRLPVALLPTQRGTRLAGQSKHRFVPLVLHGLSAISVYAETVGVRLIVGIGVVMLFTLIMLVAVVAIRLGTDLAVPGWATTAFGLLLVIVLQMFTLVIGLTLTILFNRNNLTFLPARDYRYFVASVEPMMLHE